MILDLHNHTRYSPDSKVDPIALVRLAQSIGLHGIAITDHNAIGGIRVAAEAAGSFPDFVVIPATEIGKLAFDGLYNAAFTVAYSAVAYYDNIPAGWIAGVESSQT